MASYQARQRDPLLDQGTQAMLERRGRELLGIALVLFALAFAALLGSYSPNDPGWMVATEEPARNMLGRFGAAVSSTLIILIGRGAWSIPLILLAWGVRFILHRGGERALARIVFAVIAVALASAYAATLAAPSDWPHAFGLGGLFGDTVAGALVGVIPGSLGFGLKLLSILAFFGLVAMMLYVTGFDRAELRAIRWFLLTGSVMGYNAAMNAMGKGETVALTGAMRGARGLQERAAAHRASRSAETVHGGWDEPPVMGAAPALAAPAKPAAPLTRARSNIAILQALDKVTAETIRFEAPVGQPVRYKTLVFTVRACETTAADEPVQDYSAYILIDSQALPTPGKAAPPARQAFRGWMYARSPGLNPLQHPVYDAWLISCRTSAPAAPAPKR